MPKPFTWSFSRLKNYRTCPKRHYEIEIAKSVKEDEGDALKWGHSVHEAFANTIARNKPLPEGMANFAPWVEIPQRYRDQGYQVLAENQLAMSSDLRRADWFGPTTWFRAVVDVLAISPNGRGAIAIDWKTGKIHPEYEQLALTAQVIFAHYPKVEVVSTAYVWLGEDEFTWKSYRRDEMLPVWQEVSGTLKQMVNSWNNNDYPPKPGYLCRKFCPVVSCPHHGKVFY